MANLKPYATAKTAIQKRSRSSILKRTLNDDDIIPDDLCDVNGGVFGGSQPKRVSFARTYKLKEFIKESDMLTLPSVDGTGVTEHLAVIGMSLTQPTPTSSASAAAAGSRTLCDSVAMEITNMTCTTAAPAVVGEDIEDDFSAFLAAHDNDPPTLKPAMKSNQQQQQQPTIHGDADVEDNNDLLGGDDSKDDDEESRRLRRQLFGSRLVAQMHQLLHHELLGERILPMPNYSDTSSCESLKLAAAATVAAAALGGSSSSGSSMTMITSSSASATATVSQHFFQAYQQSELHHHHLHHNHLRQHAHFAASSTRCTTTDLAPFHDESLMSTTRQLDQQKPLPEAPSDVGNNSLQDRCRELEELFHSVCHGLSPGRGRASSAAAAAAADSSALALERSLFGGSVGSDNMSIVTATVCQPLAAQINDSNDVSFDDGQDVANPVCPSVSDVTCLGDSFKNDTDKDGSNMVLDTVGVRDSVPKHEAAAAAHSGPSFAPQVANKNEENKEDTREASSFMSLSTGISPNSRGPIPPTPSILKSPAPSSSVAVGSPFRRLFEPASDTDSPLLLPPRSCRKSTADSPMLVEDIMRRASDNLMVSMPSACYSGAFCLDNSTSDELFAEIRRVCDQLPLKLKLALLSRFQLERERCQVDVALGSLNSLCDAADSQIGAEDAAAALYRRRLGEAASDMVAKLLPDILAGDKVRSLCSRLPVDQLARLKQRGRQLLMEKSRCLLSAALDSAVAEASVDRVLRPPPCASSKRRSQRLDSWLSTPPARGELSTAEDCAPLFNARLVAESAFCTVQCSVSEDPPIVLLKYLHSRLHISCRVLFEEREAKRTDNSQGPDTELAASAGDSVRVLSFTCSVWKDGCSSGLYGQFSALFNSTAALLRDSLSYCCMNMPLAKFEQRAYDIVKPAYLLLLDFVRLQLVPCQVRLDCLAEKSVACSFVVMSSLKAFLASSRASANGQTGTIPQQPPPVYRVSVRIYLPDIDRFFSTQPANRSPAGDGIDSVFSVDIEQDSCGGLFELIDAESLSGRIKERIGENQRQPLTSAYDASLRFLNSLCAQR